MSSKVKNLSDHGKIKVSGVSRFKIAIVVATYHDDITFPLKDACIDTLKKYGVKEKNIFIEPVPGAWELPLAAKWMYDKLKADAVIALGCVIKGETEHDVYINTSVSQALMNLGIQTGSPFVFGVLTPNNIQQAKDRAGGKYGNKGVECAVTALKMLGLKAALRQ